MKSNTYLFLGIALIIAAIVLLALVWLDIVSFPFAGWVPWIMGAIGASLLGVVFNEESQKTSLFKLLVAVAAQDGKITEEEKENIIGYANQFGIKDKQLEAILKEVGSGKFDVAVPDNQADKEKNIKALVKMANCDGHIDSKELKLIKNVASHYGLSESFVDSLIK